MGITTFLADLWVFVSLGIAVFWGIATYAFATWSPNLSRPLIWALVGAVAPLIGLVVAVIMHFSHKHNDVHSGPAVTPMSEDLW